MLEESLKDNTIKIHIGSENRTLEFDEYTLITANYSVADNICGTLGIIGPMRMEYDKVIPTIGGIADSISRLFIEMV